MKQFYTNVISIGNKIAVRGFDKNGEPFKEKHEYKPWFFLTAEKNSDTEYRTIHGNSVDMIMCKGVRDFRDNYNKYRDIEGIKLYGLENPEYLYIYENYENIKPDFSKIRVAIIDIEVSMEEGPAFIDSVSSEITAITIQYPNQGITFALGCGDFVSSDPSVKYKKCTSEYNLLQVFYRIINNKTYAPDVITGWYIEYFDIPYLIERTNRLFTSKDEEDGAMTKQAKKFSPWGIIRTREVMVRGKSKILYYPKGMAVLDYLDMYKKFVGVFEPQPTYRLDHIAYVELGERKLDYSEYGKLQTLYEQDYQKFIEYNIRDCDLIRRIDQKRHLLDIVYIIAYDSGVNYEDALGTVRSWDVAIHNQLLDKNIVIPANKKHDVVRPPVGGFVKDPIRGMYNWIVSFDLQSLYPHLIMAYNIGPDAYRGKLKKDFRAESILDGAMKPYKDYLMEHDVAVAGNSVLFDRKEISFLSQAMKDLFIKRKQFKDKMIELKKEQEKSNTPEKYDSEIAHYDTLQYTMKVRLNSAYGALAEKHFRWFSLDMAEAVTKSGQLTIKWAEKYINALMNKYCETEKIDYIIAMDTDSVYVNMEKIVTSANPKNPVKYLDRFCQIKIQPFLDKMYEKLYETMNCREQAMFMKREAIADRGVFVAKKRYMLNVLNNEGVQYHKPKLKILGIECVRSSTPESARKAIEESIRIILQENETALHNFIKKYRKEYQHHPFSEIAFNSSVNHLTNYENSNTIYGKKAPVYYRGSLLYNHYRKKYGLENSIEEIFEGEKVKYAYLQIPNPINEDVIAAPSDKIPPELGLEKYLDYDKQFEKSFLVPIRTILNIIGWTEKPVNKISDLWKLEK